MNDLFYQRKKEFIKFIKIKKRLPNMWEMTFTDGEDARIWFDSLLKLDFDYAKSFVNEIYSIYNIRTLNELEKENEYIEYVRVNSGKLKQGYHYFSDGVDMFKWLYPIKDEKKNFAKFVRNIDMDYYELEMPLYWPRSKKELVDLIKKLKRLPDYGEKVLLCGLDARALINKLLTYDPDFIETMLLHIESYKTDKMDVNARINAYLMAVENLGYRPFLQECRFIDGTDMYTWINKYERIIPNLKEEIDSRILDDYKIKK